MLPSTILALLMSSFKPEAEIFTYPIKWLPSRFRWENYVEIFRLVPFKQYYINTIVITSLSVVGTLISCSLAAYGFARMEFLGKNALFILTLSVMMLPVHVTVIPLFVMFRRLGWIDTFYPLIVPHFFGTAYYIFLLRQFFATLPKSLEDAAIVDGCSRLRVFTSIFLPLSKPALVTVMIFTFLSKWNEFFYPLLFLNSMENYTLTLGLQGFQGEYANYWHYLMAGTVLTIFPCLVLFCAFQRYFVEGIATTGLKG